MSASLKRLRHTVEQVLADMARLLSLDRAFDPARSDRIFRIGGSDHASRRVLPPLCAALHAMDSRIRLFWESPAFSTIGERLRKGDLQVAVLPRPEPPSDLGSRELYQDDYVLAARTGHPRGAGVATLDAFCALPHAVPGYGVSALDNQIDQALARLARSRHAQVAVTSFSQMAELLASTDLVGVLPRGVALVHAASVEVHSMPFELERYTVFVAWDRRANDDPGTMWLAGEIERTLRRP